MSFHYLLVEESELCAVGHHFVEDDLALRLIERIYELQVDLLLKLSSLELVLALPLQLFLLVFSN